MVLKLKILFKLSTLTNSFHFISHCQQCLKIFSRAVLYTKFGFISVIIFLGQKPIFFFLGKKTSFHLVHALLLIMPFLWQKAPFSYFQLKKISFFCAKTFILNRNFVENFQFKEIFLIIVLTFSGKKVLFWDQKPSSPFFLNYVFSGARSRSFFF